MGNNIYSNNIFDFPTWIGNSAKKRINFPFIRLTDYSLYSRVFKVPAVDVFITMFNLLVKYLRIFHIWGRTGKHFLFFPFFAL